MKNNNEKLNILLLDTVPSVSLAMTRSLGKEGHFVAGTNHLDSAQSFEVSKYSNLIFKSPDPHEVESYTRFLEEILLRHRFDFIIPMSEPTLKVLSISHRVFAPLAKFTIPDETSASISLSKRKTLQFAKSIKVPIPFTLFPESLSEVENFARQLKKYPAVIKGEHGGHLSRITYVRSAHELVHKYKRLINTFSLSKPEEMPIIQEYIEGIGVGYFALFHRGVEKAFFMHERVLEYPITGGPSSVAKSVYIQKLRESGRRFLEELNWTGLAMVEFKRLLNSDNYVLMEINPRPWGSMALPISLGINFPLWNVHLGCGINNDFPKSYPTNHYFIWLFPNTMMNCIAQPLFLRQVFSCLLTRKTKTDLDIKDISPVLKQIRLCLWQIKDLLINKKSIRYPQGKP